jgi:hypothetical protein
MTDVGIKRLILVSALEAEMQGMIAENKTREAQGLAMAYDCDAFYGISARMEEIAHKHDDEILGG